ncbi:protein THEMIS2 [Brienomyrus brachyistius]|uniref:protein THEMIS2 n=1 Tax=Brienomyrus brachyistius TaxID=42636 RepID=UPI0020B3A841|nr:protein THEMIS2 [Brienomyrus brachyistius]
MEGTETDAVSMQAYIESLDTKTLPRILQVCSGVYFQGSVYEVSGSEVCLSTGDMVKIIGTNLLSANTEDISTKETSELPLNYKGMFKMVLEDMPYFSVEEMVELLPVDLKSFHPISFISCHCLEVKGRVVEAGQVLTLMGPRTLVDEMPSVRCQIEGHRGPSSEIFIPLSCRGKFYEHDSGHTYNLEQILSSPRLCTRYFRDIKTTKCGGPLKITPIYQVQAIMSMRKDVVTFPSSLEVDVVDVTEKSQSVKFVTPLSLAEVMAKPPERFPAMAEVVEGPSVPSLFKSPWVENLQKGQRLLLHSCCDSPMVLASTLKSKKAQQHFLVAQNYGGRLRRRPREFAAVYELCGALQQAPNLSVTASRHCEALEEGLDSLSAGDQLDILRNQMVEVQGNEGELQKVEVLVCRRLSEADEDDDEEDEDDGEDESEHELLLPMYLEGHFVERIKDKKKYSLANLLKQFPLPLDVKVATKDVAVRCDPLSDHPGLQLKETVIEPVVLASLASKPGECFQLPSRWLSMALYLTGDPLPWREGQAPKMQCETVMELTEAFYHEFLTQAGSADVLPPPLPPKRITESKTSHQRSESLSTQLDQLTLSNEKKPKKSLPPPPVILEDPPPVLERKPISPASTQPNMYVQTPKKPLKQSKRGSDSDHDYESPNEFLKNAAESVMFY